MEDRGEDDDDDGGDVGREGATAAASEAPSGSFGALRWGNPKKSLIARDSLPERERAELLEISAFSSISMTTVRMSPF